jgi:RNA polymerase sigma-70 factor, ECF subfamily
MTMPLPEPAPAAPTGQPLQAAPASTDADLVARVHRGDGSAFELIMRRHNRRLFRLARSLLRDDAEAEDVLQEAYVRAYAKLGGLTDPQALPAWLARIVANEALGRLRTAAHVVSLEEHRAREEGEDDPVDDLAADQPDPERLAASGELGRLLEAAVDALPEEFRAVFVLREVEGLSTAETAACLALRPGTVKTRLHRARLQLQETVGQHLLACSPTLFEFDGGRCDRIVRRVLARLGQPTAPDPLHSAAASRPVRPSPHWLSRLSALLGQWRTR